MEDNIIVEILLLEFKTIVALPMVLIPNIINIGGYLQARVDEF